MSTVDTVRPSSRPAANSFPPGRPLLARAWPFCQPLGPPGTDRPTEKVFLNSAEYRGAADVVAGAIRDSHPEVPTT
jgi:hypothetical protein